MLDSKRHSSTRSAISRLAPLLRYRTHTSRLQTTLRQQVRSFLSARIMVIIWLANANCACGAMSASAKLEAAAYKMEKSTGIGHHAISAHAHEAAEPEKSASGSWLSAVSAPQRQHFFLTAEEARRNLDAYFDHQKVHRALTRIAMIPESKSESRLDHTIRRAGTAGRGRRLRWLPAIRGRGAPVSSSSSTHARTQGE